MAALRTSVTASCDFVADLERALETWAREEGLVSARGLPEAYFVVHDSNEIFAALGRRERIETTFDVADYLFSGGGATGAAGEPASAMRTDEEAPITQRHLQPASLRRAGGSPRPRG